MKAVTRSHDDHQLAHNGLPTSEENRQWIETVKDRHNAAKYLQEIGELNQVEDPPNAAMVKTQLKKSKRTLRDIILGEVTNVSRLVTKEMARAQHHETGPLVKRLLAQVWKEYQGIVVKLESVILSEEQASEDDTPVLGTTKAFLRRMTDKVILIQTK